MNMADVSRGPVPTMPGDRFPVGEAARCDQHPERPAVARIQGETDSFGCEYLDVCQECLDEIRRHNALDRIGTCDWCKTSATDLRPRRDYDEGMCGPLYDVCGACVRKENERAAAYLAKNDYDDWDLD